jgi:uncharacterized protein YecE (DUF72 family)
MGHHGQIRVGISGWRFDGWRGSFYPEELTQKRELEFASRKLNSIELNGTFYSTQKPQSFQSWHKQTPNDFVFAIKGSQFITHIRKLENVEGALANFLAQGMLCLGKKLGPILWQLPPQTAFNAEKIEAFLRLLPHTHRQAAAYAKQRDEWMAGRCWLEVEEDLPFRHAMECRHKSFATPEYIELLRKYNVALVVADSVKWPVMMDVTADFIYCRLHGSDKIYPDGYTENAIDTWAQRILTWSRGEEVTDGMRIHAEAGPNQPSRDVFVYFDDDNKVRAPHDAQSMRNKIKELLPS